MSQIGVVLVCDGASGYATAPSVADSSGWTIVSYGVARAVGTASSIAGMGEAPGNASRDRTLYVDASNNAASYIYDGTSKTVTCTGASLSVGVPSLIAASCSPSTLTVYLNGASTSGAVSNSGYAAYSSPEFVVGYTSSSAAWLGSSWSAAYTLLLTRALSLAELNALRDDPLAIFAPRVIPIPLAAAGGGTAIDVGAAALTLTGYAPTIVGGNTQIAVDAGALTITGYAPTVIGGNTQISVGAGALTLTGYAPNVFANELIQPGAGSLVITGYAPSVSVNEASTILQPAAGELTITGYAPTIVGGNTQITVGTGSLSLTGYAPTILGGNTQIQVGVGALTITGFAPSISIAGSAIITPDAGSLVITGYPPTVTVSGQTVSAPVGGGKVRRVYEDDTDQVLAQNRRAVQALMAILMTLDELEEVA